MNNDKLFKSDDFIIYQEGGSIKSLNMKLSLENKNLSKLTVPLPLGFITEKSYEQVGGSKINIKEDDDISLIEESLYDELLKLAGEESNKRHNRTKKKKLYVKRKSNKRKTRKI